MSVIKSNIQLFRDTEFTRRMFKVSSEFALLQQRELFELEETFIYSEYFGSFIWDNKLFNLAEFFSREYFSRNWSAILKAVQMIGTYESYIVIIKSALGNGTGIYFENPSKSHLIINISMETNPAIWVAQIGESRKNVIPSRSQYDNKTMAFAESVSQLTTNETVALIKLLTVNGIFIEVNFSN